MLSCQQVAHLASDYLDNDTPLKWQIRLHLLMCSNCRRFVKHLAITQKVTTEMTKNNAVQNTAEIELVLQKVKQKIDSSSTPKQ